MIYVLVAVLFLLTGFGLGRVKNAKKLAAVQVELDKVVAEAKAKL